MKYRILIGCILFSPLTLLADYVCDPSLSTIKDKSYGYHKRGDYCEGLYEEGYSSRVDIKLVGYHIAPFDFITGFDNNVSLSVRAPAGKSVHTVILDNLLSKFYRRDQEVTVGNPVDLSLDVLKTSKVSLQANQLVGMACLPRCFENPDIYYPIMISTTGEAASNPALYLELPLNTKKVRLSAVHQKTKAPYLDKTTNKPIEQVRSFENKVVNLVEVFSFPVLDESAYLEVDVLYGEGKGKVISRSFLLGGSSD